MTRYSIYANILLFRLSEKGIITPVENRSSSIMGRRIQKKPPTAGIGISLVPD